jgi:BlaI family transcriptional regulator, penicillinase repressor
MTPRARRPVEVRVHDREWDLLEVLWERGSATVAEVREALEDDLAYNTVLTILRRLEDKGYVRHEEEGRAHRYFATVERDQVRKSALQRLVDGVFGGSPELLLTHLVAEKKLTKPQIRRLHQLLKEQLAKPDQ